MAKAHSPIHPGEVLLEEFLKPMELSQHRLAKDITVPARRINEIVHGKRAITADTALRLTATQTCYELKVEKARLKTRLAKEVTIRRKAS